MAVSSGSELWYHVRVARTMSVAANIFGSAHTAAAVREEMSYSVDDFTRLEYLVGAGEHQLKQVMAKLKSEVTPMLYSLYPLYQKVMTEDTSHNDKMAALNRIREQAKASVSMYRFLELLPVPPVTS